MLELLYNDDTIYEAEMRSISSREYDENFFLESYIDSIEFDEVSIILQQQHEDNINRHLNHDIPFECHVENFYSY